jgi:hypothetical protein
LWRACTKRWTAPSSPTPTPDALSEIADEVIKEAARLAVALPEDAADHYWPAWPALG